MASRKERHRDGGSGREEQERRRGLGRIRNRGEQKQRKPARAADAVHEPDPIGAYGRPDGDSVSVLVGPVFPV
jgi:hypothetical protein